MIIAETVLAYSWTMLFETVLQMCTVPTPGPCKSMLITVLEEVDAVGVLSDKAPIGRFLSLISGFEPPAHGLK